MFILRCNRGNANSHIKNTASIVRAFSFGLLIRHLEKNGTCMNRTSRVSNLVDLIHYVLHLLTVIQPYFL